MLTKTKEAPKRAEAAPQEMEHEHAPRGKHAKPARGRVPRNALAGAFLLYEADPGDTGGDALYEAPLPPMRLLVPEREAERGLAGEGEDRLPHLAMVSGHAQPLPRRPQAKPAPRLPAARPSSRLACERRCGGAGCDPSNSHGCGGVFCLDGTEQL